jgi:hypothetical protein
VRSRRNRLRAAPLLSSASLSGYFLRLVPADPAFVPPEAARNAACDALRAALPRAEEVTATVSETLRFVSPEANLERILCPACAKDLDRDWWQGHMDHASSREFRNLRVTVPCCGAATSLDRLDYEWPAGFARFVLEASNPNVSELPGQQLRALGRLLGCQLRQIWARYV